MAFLLNSEKWATMNVGCAMDEGLAHTEKDKFTIFYGERTPWWLCVECKGPTGHGSRFIKGTATNTLTRFLGIAQAYRRDQELALGGWGCGHAKCKKLGDVTTINCTMIQAGVSPDGGKNFAYNVIPTEARAGLDVRLPVDGP